MQVIAIEFVLLRLDKESLRFVRPVESKQVRGEVGVGDDHVGINAHRLFGKGDGLVVLPQLGGNVPEVAGGHGVMRIALGPEFVGLRRLFQFPGDRGVVHGRDAVFLALADLLAKSIGFL